MGEESQWWRWRGLVLIFRLPCLPGLRCQRASTPQRWGDEGHRDSGSIPTAQPLSLNRHPGLLLISVPSCSILKLPRFALFWLISLLCFAVFVPRVRHDGTIALPHSRLIFIKASLAQKPGPKSWPCLIEQGEIWFLGGIYTDMHAVRPRCLVLVNQSCWQNEMYFSWLVIISSEKSSEMPLLSQNTGKARLGLKLNRINQYRLGFLVVTPFIPLTLPQPINHTLLWKQTENQKTPNKSVRWSNWLKVFGKVFLFFFFFLNVVFTEQFTAFKYTPSNTTKPPNTIHNVYLTLTRLIHFILILLRWRTTAAAMPEILHGLSRMFMEGILVYSNVS